MNSEKIAGFMLVIFSMGCQQPGEPTTSVDGLEGGTITSSVSVPVLDADEVTATTGTFDRVETTDLTAEAVEASAVNADSVTTSTLVVRGLPVFGLPLGAVDYSPSPNSDAGYRHADNACSTAFGEQAHVCSADEVLVAFRSGVELDQDLDGAAINTHSFQVVGQEINEASASSHERLFVVNDCDGWVSTRQVATVRQEDDDPLVLRANLGLSPVQRWIDGAMVLFAGDTQNGSWRLRPNIDRCDQVRLACCG